MTAPDVLVTTSRELAGSGWGQTGYGPANGARNQEPKGAVVPPPFIGEARSLTNPSGTKSATLAEASKNLVFTRCNPQTG